MDSDRIERNVVPISEFKMSSSLPVLSTGDAVQTIVTPAALSTPTEIVTPPVTVESIVTPAAIITPTPPPPPTDYEQDKKNYTDEITRSTKQHNEECETLIK